MKVLLKEVHLFCTTIALFLFKLAFLLKGLVTGISMIVR